MRRCVWSRNLKNEEAMPRGGTEKKKISYLLSLSRHSKKNISNKIIKLTDL